MNYLRILLLRFLAIFYVSFFSFRCTTVQHIDPSLKPLVYEFIKDAERYGRHPDIKRLGSLTYDEISVPFYPNVVGLCLPIMLAGVTLPHSSTVYIDPIYPYDSYSFKALVYHELSHCLLDEPHRENDEIMAKTMIRYEEYYALNWEPLLEELFTHKKTEKIKFPYMKFGDE